MPTWPESDVIRYWYNSAGGRHSAVRGAGSGGYYTVYYRDPLQRLSVLANDLPVAADHSIELAYNPASQIVGRTLSNDSYATPPAYNVSRAYAVNGLNQYTSAGPATFTYDSNGNLTSDGTTSYTYDVENRLVASSAGASLVYDPLGRLFQISGGVAGATQFNYDGDKLIAEYSGSTLLRRYVHGPGADEPVAVYEGAGLGLAGRRYTMPDERGSIVGLVNADGTPSAYNRYDAWGIPGAGNQGRFQYTGQTWLPELGMYHYKARIYSPTLGRFMQVDPIGYEDQINLYAYVGNDPINETDPTGEATQPGCGSRLGDSAACSGETVLGQIEAAREREPHGPRQYGQGGKSRPTKARPGGRITQAQADCRSCHGVGTDDDRRYSTEAENELLIELVSLIPAVRITQVPRRAHQVARVVQRTGGPPRGYVGGRTFQNRERRLPGSGKYREFDIDPRPSHGSRNAERIVVDTRTGRRWYTSDHYDSFTEF